MDSIGPSIFKRNTLGWWTGPFAKGVTWIFFWSLADPVESSLCATACGGAGAVVELGAGELDGVGAGAVAGTTATDALAAAVASTEDAVAGGSWCAFFKASAPRMAANMTPPAKAARRGVNFTFGIATASSGEEFDSPRTTRRPAE